MSPTIMMATGTAISDPTRLLILFSLGAGPLSVGQLAVRAHVTSPSVSHHLRKLIEGELVRIERRGRCTVVRRNEHRWQTILSAFATAE
jgi:DNA-binding transcriptional ArsR family regulator